MKRVLKFALLGLVLGAMASGCRTNTAGLYVEKGRMRAYNAVLAEDLDVKTDIARMTSTGQLEVQVTVQNRNKTDYRCRYRFVWFDKDGMELRNDAIERVETFYGCDEKRLKDVSAEKNAADFRLCIYPDRQGR